MKCSTCNQEGHNKRSCISSTSVSATKTINPSKNAAVARSGFSAEELLCRSTDILRSIGREYFHKEIVNCEKIKGNKKSDVLITFQDGTQTRVQLKNGTGGGRGWSFDRRSVDLLPITDEAKELIRVVCLKKSGERKDVAKDENLIKTLIFGTDDENKPEHFIHTTVENGKIVQIGICSASEFIDTVLKDIYETVCAKRTCVHITPLIYLQRKGGGTADHSPNDIQAKLRCMPDCMRTIPIGETNLPQQEQRH